MGVTLDFREFFESAELVTFFFPVVTLSTKTRVPVVPASACLSHAGAAASVLRPRGRPFW